MEDKVSILQNAISVSELNATIHACIDAPIFQGIEVFGEVSGYKLSGPHAYFTIKDQNAQISCVRFYAARDYQPKDGESVVLRGRLDYYIKGGRLSLQVSSITPIGQGLLFLQFEKLKQKLTAEGYFDDAHKKPIPKFPRNVVVVTSKTGAVIRDIVTTVRRKNPILNLTVKDVRVQGEDAARDIASALARVDALGYDVVILARGGGSLEDLAPFYDESVVKAIYAMNTPVISAVGHETDFSLADFVADVRAATPTAAGELVGYDYYALISSVLDNARRMKLLVDKQLEKKTLRVKLSANRMSHKASTFYTEKINRVKSATVKMSNAIAVKIKNAEYRLDKAMVSLDNLSPIKTLRRGYFSISQKGGAITSVKNISVGDSIVATGGDGTLKATVTEVSVKED